MRVSVAFIAAAPLALLAACGESTPVDEMNAEPMETVLATEAAEPEPISAIDLSQADYTGAYTMIEEDGTRETITLNPDMTFEYTTSDGLTRTGEYRVMDDDLRLMIEDFDGRAAYFSLDDDTLYRLASQTADPTDRILAIGEYHRQSADRDGSRNETGAQDESEAQPIGENAAMPTGPDATTDNTADRRQ